MSRFLARRSADEFVPPRGAAPVVARMPPGVRAYAFGDVHGRYDLLDDMLEAVETDLARARVERVLLIGLGDYVDRGPESRRVVERLATLAPRAGLELAFLKGNHEAQMLRFLESSDEAAAIWLGIGGWATLRSYGVNPRAGHMLDGAELQGMRDELAAAIPPAHLVFLETLKPALALGDYFLVHAGVDYRRGPREQIERDILWRRPTAPDEDKRWEMVVVHGHSPVERPFSGRHRVNVDTGAFATGRLSCVVLEGEARRFLEVVR